MTKNMTNVMFIELKKTSTRLFIILKEDFMDDWLPFSYTFLILSFDFPLTFLWGEQKMEFFGEL
jgi:hypothetical protein